MARTLECPRHFLDFVDFELVADLEVVEVFQGHAALETGFHLAHVILEALEGIDLARMDDHVVAQHTHHRVATHETLEQDRKSTRLNSSHMSISYAVFCLKKKKK